MSNSNINIDLVSSDVKPKDTKDLKCAPGHVFESGSCIRLCVLVEVVRVYNLENTNNPIITNDSLQITNPKKYKIYLVKELRKKLSNCTNQKCWTKQTFVEKMKEEMRNELVNHTFRPDGPNGKFEWLNTFDIKNTMEQYEKKYPEFKFLGAVPIDFDDFENFGIVNLDYNRLIKEGKTKIGIVFNLDEHDQPGSHWVALFCDLKKGQIYYFDSYGIIPEQRIRKLMRRIAKFCQISLGNKNIDVDYNKIQHQFENSECGVYSINFILRMLRGDDFKTICESKTSDTKMNKCRRIYFYKSK